MAIVCLRRSRDTLVKQDQIRRIKTKKCPSFETQQKKGFILTSQKLSKEEEEETSLLLCNGS
jgi:hypothetical protein